MKKFTPPTIAEARAYCEELEYPDYAEAFVTHHEMLGWVYGKHQTPIKSWKAALRYWHSREKEKPERPELQPYDASSQSAPTTPPVDEEPMTAAQDRSAKQFRDMIRKNVAQGCNDKR